MMKKKYFRSHWPSLRKMSTKHGSNAIWYLLYHIRFGFIKISNIQLPASCDLSSQKKIHIWRTLDHMLGKTMFHSLSMLYRIHQLPQANCENVFEGRRIQAWTKIQSSQSTVLSSIIRLTIILFSFGFSCAHLHLLQRNNLPFEPFHFFYLFGFTIPSIHPHKCSCCSMLNPMNIKVKCSNSAALSTLANRHFETRDNFIFRCGHSFVYSFATCTFLPRSKLMCDSEKRCHSTVTLVCCAIFHSFVPPHLPTCRFS